MPGFVTWGRRWSVGSDDLVVPSAVAFVVHVSWIVALSTTVAVHPSPITNYTAAVPELHPGGEDKATASSNICYSLFFYSTLVNIGILASCSVSEVVLAWISCQGTVLLDFPRRHIIYAIYVRLALVVFETGWFIWSIYWLAVYSVDCTSKHLFQLQLGITICSGVLLLFVPLLLYCFFDPAGKQWLRLQKYEATAAQASNLGRGMPSGGLAASDTRDRRAHWRRRRAFAAYQSSWLNRIDVLFCQCCCPKNSSQQTFQEIARLFTEFFHDVDFVPTDVIAGLVVLRQSQKRAMGSIIRALNPVQDFLSGIPVSSQSRFLPISESLPLLTAVQHYMSMALAVYGWPMHLLTNPVCGLCKLSRELNCLFCRPYCETVPREHVLDDNLCQCNYAAFRHMGHLTHDQILYSDYHVDVGQTPFSVIRDERMESLVICIRGTLSLKDVLTDLSAEAELIPGTRTEMYAHKGMLAAANYVYEKLAHQGLLTRCLAAVPPHYRIVIVGHSLGAGAAAILAILLKSCYPRLHCYSFSPPGGLLSRAAVESSADFITSVILGKDMVPRIGLHQIEVLRTDMLNALKESPDSKWCLIGATLCPACCRRSSTRERSNFVAIKGMRNLDVNPVNDRQLVVHQRLYPPGMILHVVKKRPTETAGCCRQRKAPEEDYEIMLTSNYDMYDELLISPTMISDHMPHEVLKALTTLAGPLRSRPPPADGSFPMRQESFKQITARRSLFGGSVVVRQPRSTSENEQKKHDSRPPARPSPILEVVSTTSDAVSPSPTLGTPKAGVNGSTPKAHRTIVEAVSSTTLPSLLPVFNELADDELRLQAPVASFETLASSGAAGSTSLRLKQGDRWRSSIPSRSDRTNASFHGGQQRDFETISRESTRSTGSLPDKVVVVQPSPAEPVAIDILAAASSIDLTQTFELVL